MVRAKVRTAGKVLKSVGIAITLLVLLLGFILGLFVTGGVWGVISFVVGFGLIALLTMLLGNAFGLRDLVFSLATNGYDRFVLYETPAEYHLCPVREHTDTAKYDYEFKYDGAWKRFEDTPDRWHEYNGVKVGLLWEKTADNLESSAAVKRWQKDKEYVIDASNELGPYREAGDPGVVQRVREVVLKRETADSGTSMPMQFVISIGGLVIGAIIGIILVLIG